MPSKKNEDLMRMAAEIGAKTALATIEKEREKEVKSRHDRRLRNTKLLLRNYRELQSHVKNAVFDVSQMEEEENAIDILDLMMARSTGETTYVESIKKSVKRTAIIMQHVNDMLELYEAYCQRSKKPEDLRRYRTIQYMYISDFPITAEEIAETEGVAVRTVYKDIDAAVEKLSALIFGIDGLKSD